MPARVPGRILERMSDRMSKYMSDKMSARMPGRISEYMSHRMLWGSLEECNFLFQIDPCPLFSAEDGLLVFAKWRPLDNIFVCRISCKRMLIVSACHRGGGPSLSTLFCAVFMTFMYLYFEFVFVVEIWSNKDEVDYLVSCGGCQQVIPFASAPVPCFCIARTQATRLHLHNPCIWVWQSQERRAEVRRGLWLRS